jgi:hypothetical protein
MDEKQTALVPGNVKVFGFIWSVLNDSVSVYRIIEPPNVTLKTTTYPDGAEYSGGVIFVLAAFGANITAQRTRFPAVAVDNLTESFTSSKVMSIEKPTKILVISGNWGYTHTTLSWMSIPYTKVEKSAVESDPTMLLNYDLVVDDCEGWWDYGSGTMIPSGVIANMRALANNGGEVIFTDIALLDMAAVFPGYVNVVSGLANTWIGNVSIHNPPLTNFSSEYPSQYPATFPSTVKLYKLSYGYIVGSVVNSSGVRVVVDSSSYGGYRIFACYFPYGKGVVEAFAYHPQEQTEAFTGDPNSYVVSALLYGNKFVARSPSAWSDMVF